MQKFLLFLSAFFALVSCEPVTLSKDQNTKNTILLDEEVTPDIQQLRQAYILSYNKPVEFESLSKGKDSEQVKLYGKYYCLFDSAIIVPSKYNFDDTTKTFTTHNFAEDIVIIINGDTILEKTITKKDFLNKLPQDLKDHAVMFEPTFEGYDSRNDAFNFTFSISIPLTDIGKPMNLNLNRNGQITVRGNE